MDTYKKMLGKASNSPKHNQVALCSRTIDSVYLALRTIETVLVWTVYFDNMNIATSITNCIISGFWYCVMCFIFDCHRNLKRTIYNITKLIIKLLTGVASIFFWKVSEMFTLYCQSHSDTFSTHAGHHNHDCETTLWKLTRSARSDYWKRLLI